VRRAHLGDEAAVELLVGAVERPSPSGREAEVSAYLARAMRGVADEAFVDAVGNVVVRVGSGPRVVTLLGHVDTVPGDVPVRLDRGVLYGRGSVDAKGPLCAMLAGASRLGDAARSELSVYVIGAVEEEAASSRGARHALATYPPPELLVIGEPSGWDGITLGYKGRLTVTVEARRPNSHAARDDATAAEIVLAATEAVRAWARSRSARAARVFDGVQVTVEAVTSRNDGLEQCSEARLSLRLPPDCPPEAAEAAARRAVGAVAGTHRHRGGAVTLRAAAGERAHRGPRDTPLTRALRTAIRREGGRPRLTLKTGTSDMNVLAGAWDVPMAAYGPGDAALDHTPDEHLDLDEYLRAIRVLTRALEALAGGALGEGTTGRPG
jgi:[amino group carrier protein]-lysine/ornithine hydrolase